MRSVVDQELLLVIEVFHRDRSGTVESIIGYKMLGYAIGDSGGSNMMSLFQLIGELFPVVAYFE
jgi:hypothetical protein